MKLTFTLLSSLFVYALSFGQGIIFDEQKYAAAPAFEPQAQQGFSTFGLPTRVSYRAYCPPIQSQGQLATCVGWATSYALLSTQQNILMGETDVVRKSIRRMDPNFVYALIRNYNDQWCQSGTNMTEAMEVLFNYGSKPLLTPPWLSCNSTTEFDDFAMAIASRYSPLQYYALKDKTDLVNTLKATLNNKHPLAIGMQLTNSFFTGSGVSYGKWTPKGSEQIDGAHAMCIIGYDDNKYGGSFELMNSYGKQFGDQGFIWITYSDMIKYLREAYVIFLNEGQGGYRTGSCSFGDCYSSYSRYKYSSGEVYEGEFKNGYRDGWGVLLETSGNLYLGGFTNGYKNGGGIYFIASTGTYYKTNFSFGTLKSTALYQGFSGSEEDQKLSEAISKMQTIMPGKVVEMDSKKYEKFINSIKPEEEPERVDSKQ
jgi:hypothetical protein